MKVELRGITKTFPGVVANKDVDLTLEAGEVHALLGENGAGKSTLMNVLFGLYEQDAGTILLEDEEVAFKNPNDAIAAGIGMVHQHFMLVPVFTVTENVMLGVEPTGAGGLLHRHEARAKLVELSEEYGLTVDPDAVVEDLPVGVQQRVEILKALYRDADCLILDEPTAVLTPQETQQLFRVIEALKERGRSIVFISHKLKEVLTIADRISVLRRGELVGSATPAETTEQELATMMVGREVQLEVPKDKPEPGAPVLEVRDLHVLDDRGQIAVDGVSFNVRAGEILGVAGVQGNGQTELVEAITGMRKPASGTILIDGKDVTGRSPRALFNEGVAHVPEDRQGDGLVTSFPIKDNLVLNSFSEKPFARGLRINRGAVKESAEALVDEYDIRTTSIDATASTLSGGNQQKLIVAREFSQAKRLLIAAQPTRGLDVGSIQYIHAQVVAKRDEGVAVVIVSSELDEVLSLGDRIAVMYQGRIADILERENATREECGLLMAGSKAPRPSMPKADESAAPVDDPDG
ncbi:MAG: ABC transporter ATP-binding protein [Actinomycetota bacterium]